MVVVPLNYTLVLDRVCNRSASLGSVVNDSETSLLRCDPVCGRAQCISGYRADASQCGKRSIEIRVAQFDV
jgi:hypothetical protein